MSSYGKYVVTGRKLTDDLNGVPNPSTPKGLAQITIFMRRKFGLESVPMAHLDLNSFTRAAAMGSPDYFLDDILNSRDPNTMKMRTDELAQMYTAMCWQDSGFNTFDLTHSMTSALLLTDPSEVSPEEVKLPYEAFVIRVPKGFFHLNDYYKRTQDATMIIVHRMQTDGGPRIFLRLCGLADIQDTTTLTSAWEFLKDPEEHQTMGEWIETELPISNQSVASPNDVIIDRHMLRGVRRLFVNLCLYISAKGLPPRRVKKEKKSKKNKKRQPRGSMQGPEFWVIGQEVKLDPRLIESAKHWTESQGKNRTTASWKISSQFTVRGHWRNQAHGPGRTLRTRKWIAPYWKGEGAGKIGHLYTTHEKEKR